MIRRFLPEGTTKTTAPTVAYIEAWMNRYPRKNFNYKTPTQMFRAGYLILTFAKELDQNLDYSSQAFYIKKEL
jgi:hypothetical protein